MKPLQLSSITDQVAAHLRREIERGALAGDLPGAKKLAEQLGVNHKTIDAAAALLEHQGLLQTQGAGRPRRIVRPKGLGSRSLRVGMLIYSPDDVENHLIINLRHTLAGAGHTCVFAEKSQMELRWDVQRVASMIQKANVDAWIVQSSSHEILAWFAQQKLPFIALHGRFMELPVAATGVTMIPAIEAAVDHLVQLGHRRIVTLAQESDLTPHPGVTYKAYIKRLESHGIATSSYNLPRWTSSPEGLHQALDSLFKLTPPTALLITDVALFFPTYVHLLGKGLKVPEDLSLICADDHPHFRWCRPGIAHISWDYLEAVRHILQWANHVASGKPDMKQRMVKSDFIISGSIGPAPGTQ